jgi:restriction endonuclease S subunit
LCVSRKRLLESIDCSLSGDRYRLATIRATGSWPITKLKEVAFEIRSGFACGQSDKDSEGVPHLRPMNISANGQLVWEATKYISEEEFAGKEEYLLKAGDVLFNNTNSKELVGKTCYVDRDVRGGYSNHITRIRPDTAKILPRLLAIFLHELWHRGIFINLCHKWIGQAGINNALLSEVEFPLPHLDEQERIVAELEGYRNIIEGARQVIDNYQPVIRIDPRWPTKKISEVCELVRGSSPRPKSDPRYYGGNVPRLMVADVTRDGMFVTPKIDFLTEEGSKHSRFMKAGEVVMAVSGNPGLASILTTNAYIHDGFVGFRNLRDELLPEFFYFVLTYFKEHSDSLSIGAVFKNLTTDQIKEFDIPIPTLDAQKDIVATLQSERTLVESNRKLIEIFEAKIKAKLDEIWGPAEEADRARVTEDVQIETQEIGGSLM